MKTIDDLAREIAKDTGYPIVNVREFFRALIRVVDKMLRQGDTIIITSLVKIAPAIRKPRRVHNVVKKEIVVLPEKVGVSLSAGKTVLDAIATLTPDKVVDKK